MAYTDYEICPGCDRKALYMGDGQAPEGIEVWHAECRRAAASSGAVAAERQRIWSALKAIECWDDYHALVASLAAADVASPLSADPGVTCQATADALPSRPHAAGGCTLCVGGLCTEVCTDHPCTAMSRFVVERSDGDRSFGWDGKHEACAEHLADAVTGMVNGDPQLHAVVAIRWDKEN